MDPGRLDLRAQVFRRPPILDDEGRDTGDRQDYAPVFTVWANFRTQSVREVVQGGGAQNVEDGALTIRDSAQARTVTNADRVLLQSRNFAITGVGLPDRRTGLIVLTLSSNLGGQ